MRLSITTPSTITDSNNRRLANFTYIGLLLTTIALASSISVCEAFADVYVAPSGNDSAEGSRIKPLATLQAAVAVVRRSRDAGSVPRPVTIWLADGTYTIPQTLKLEGPRDSQITIRAAHHGKAILDASIALKESQFVRSQDPRLQKEVIGKVWECDLKKAGVQHAKKFPNRFNDTGGLFQLFCDDLWQPISRWPNDRNAKMKKVLDRGDDPGAPGKRPGKFVFDGDRPARWTRAAESGQLWLAGFWRVAWDWQSVRVDKIDLKEKSILLASPIFLGIGSKYAGPEGAGTEPWRAINLVEEIDMPGEWAVDFQQGKLFSGRLVTLHAFMLPIGMARFCICSTPRM